MVLKMLVSMDTVIDIAVRKAANTFDLLLCNQPHINRVVLLTYELFYVCVTEICRFANKSCKRRFEWTYTRTVGK